MKTLLKQVFQHPLPINVKEIKEKKKENKRNKERVKDWKVPVKRIWRLMEDHHVKIYFVMFLVFLYALLGLLGPFMIGRIIDNKIMPKKFDGLLTDLVILLFVYIFTSLFTYISGIMMAKISQDTIYRLRKLLFTKFQRLPIPFFDKRQHGELMSRMTNDIDTISQVLNTSFIQFTSSAITLIGTVIVMFMLSPLLTVLTMMVIPLMMIGMNWITTRTGALFKLRQQAMGEMNGYIEEIVSGQAVVKVFSQEQKVIAGFDEKNKNVLDKSYWAITYSGFIPKVMNLLNNLSFTVVAAIGAMLALKGYGVTVGTIVIFAEYARQFTRPLSDLANQFNTVLSALSGADRVFAIIDEDDEVDIHNENDQMEIKGHVQFNDVIFKYSEDQVKPTIDKVTFEVLQGESLALVGATGAGKTTIVQLLARFYEIQGGAIKIDGLSIDQINKSTLRNQMAYVLQDPLIFDGTIRDNIKYRNTHVSDEVMIQAAKDANAYDFIMKLPEGFDTEISFESTHLSQGEKQLINIARALILNPKILLLDEATSNIDTVTEMKLQEAIEKLMKNRTSIIIAHRLNTVKKADKIVVLEKGKMIEYGYQTELIVQKGIYYEMLHSGNEELLE
ncbi:ABC transporter ATP-binding protein [Macrococcus sp. DPC7161]|uniref:ABC transporter ATP-binding protein n=1 Tax=Macrococcus sp. DPC7161 TaxID=2507060 RepID=UPI00100AFA86|nr:ABC transporter ATP-binding protein [Macrococcus sp. DPC7161]RXK19028.1 ABC transporter ATP-binding protein [Macrococcus sp. DPC7161]